MTTFSDFWEIYPRRVAKKDAERAWNRLTSAQQLDALNALPLHVRYWAATSRTKETTPHAATWLNGERWTDELEMPEPAKPANVTVAWWASESSIKAKGAELGLSARGGESWNDFKGRIQAKMEAGR